MYTFGAKEVTPEYGTHCSKSSVQLSSLFTGPRGGVAA